MTLVGCGCRQASRHHRTLLKKGGVTRAAMMFKLPIAMLMATAVISAACSPTHKIVLVADPDGAVGGITVSNSAGSVEINAPNRATSVKDAHTAPDAPVDMPERDIRALFSEALAIQPPPPLHFILYFEKDSSRLDSNSLNQMADILAAIQERGSTYISVVGHADTLGDKLYNQNLSMRRAAAVRDLLIQKGVKESFVDVTSHGEKNLLIQTGDNVAEPKNRRVEVVVR